MPPDSGERAAPGPAVYSIPPHNSFADSLAAGIIARFGRDPVGLAAGRILLPNNRAVRTMLDAFVRASGQGLLLPRLIPVGDPELDERIGGALEPLTIAPVQAAIEPLERLLALTALLQRGERNSAEAARLAADLARTLDNLLVEQVDPTRLREAFRDSADLAEHWQRSFDALDVVIDLWPAILADRGRIEIADRRNRLIQALCDRWADSPPPGFTIAAGITTAAPVIARLLRRVATMAGGMVVLPGLSTPGVMPDEEWDSLDDPAHPQFHLKLLLDRMGVARGEVKRWRGGGGASSTMARTRAVANAMTAPAFSHKWETLGRNERSLSRVRVAEMPDMASEAQAIALALREALEEPGKTAALVTPNRQLGMRVATLLKRWGISADDSAGTALSRTAPGTLLLAIAEVAAEDFAPVPLLALLKHPLVAGEGLERVQWLAEARRIDLALRGPRPLPGLAGLDSHFAGRSARSAWFRLRPALEPIVGLLDAPADLASVATRLGAAANGLSGNRAWSGPAGRMAADLVAELSGAPSAANVAIAPQDIVALLRQILDSRSVRPPYGGHPRLSIWGLLEARLQQADLTILGGLNEGLWPALPSPDPWLAPQLRKRIGLPALEHRIGLSAHDFAGALGAPEVLITRSKRDGRTPTVASRFLLRLEAMTGGLPRDRRLERLALALDRPGEVRPAARPQPRPASEHRPKRVSVTSVDRLNADPFAFYAREILKLRDLDPPDADKSAAWKGVAVHEALQNWLNEDDCDPDRLRARAEALLADQSLHPMLRALWSPRLLEAIDWMAELERQNRTAGRLPMKAEIAGETTLAGIVVHGRADRIDRLGSGGLAIVDYKTGAPPSSAAVHSGFALQLGLLGLIAAAGGFEDVSGIPESHEYWSLKRHNGRFGRVYRPFEKEGAAEFLDFSRARFAQAAGEWLTGDAPFTAKLHPAYSPYGDFDQLMRLEEWYGRT